MKRHHAGEDLTDAIADAPHGPEVFERLKMIGPAAAVASAKKINERPAIVFKALAYANLFFMVVILFCVAYWNWGPPLMFLLKRG